MKTLAVSAEVENILFEVMSRRATRQELRKPVTQEQLRQAVRLALERGQQRVIAVSEGKIPQPFSWTKAIRGMFARRGTPIVAASAESDAKYAERTLVTSTPPGAYAVPTVQASEIIAQLAQYSTARAAGARVIQMRGIQKLTIPAALASSSFVWVTQGSKQSPTDMNASQLTFDLSMCQALTLIPSALFVAAVPDFDEIFTESFALAAAEAEDSALHATSTLSNAPTALMSQAGITTVMVGGSANGGNIAWSDILAVIQKSVDLKVKPVGLSWFMAGRTLNRLLSLQDGSSRPLLLPIPGMVGADGAASAYSLLGFPVYPTTGIPTNETNGSGSAQSHAVLAPGKSILIGDSGDVRLDVSMHFALDSDEVALRVQHQVAFQYSPVASVVVLLGIN